VGDAADRVKTKVDALRKRLEAPPTAAGLLDVARVLGDLGTELGRAEAEATNSAVLWPRDMNEAAGAKPWGKDSEEAARG
jgi:hypothetical protein